MISVLDEDSSSTSANRTVQRDSGQRLSSSTLIGGWDPLLHHLLSAINDALEFFQFFRLKYLGWREPKRPSVRPADAGRVCECQSFLNVSQTGTNTRSAWCGSKSPWQKTSVQLQLCFFSLVRKC